jgi:dienelactone hydrolase
MKARGFLNLFVFLSAILAVCSSADGVSPPANPGRGDQLLADYFRAETAALRERCLADITTLQEWTSRRTKYREQLLEMLGLWPMPARTDLRPVTTGRAETDHFTVEKLNFQSMPGLYVTGNLYLPRPRARPAPAILYVCGHGSVIKDGVSFGNKVTYQHHGAWFAQHGYVCLIIDTLQLGEIQGIHHGTHREAMWWWNSRGYTPAGVEAWNSLRALDYLETRSEVDPTRLGVTGRSGGGAYSWWLAAIDDRIKVAAPVAGMTDLQNHVVDGTVEGHCDCMFIVNTYRWDYPQVAALLAPRPLLIGNSDRDTIFPLDGVVRVHEKLRRIYQLYGASTNLGLLITEGPHKDTQDLQLPVFRWFNRFLKGEDPLIDTAARKYFEPEQLKVFDKLPDDPTNQTIQESFVPMTPAPIPTSPADWARQREAWMTALRERVFGGWPEEPVPLELREHCDVDRHGVRFRVYDLLSQPEVLLRLYVLQPKRVKKPERVLLNVLDDAGWDEWIAGMGNTFAHELEEERQVPSPGLARSQQQFSTGNGPAYSNALQLLLRSNNWAMAFVAPRGIGPSQWSGDARKQTHIRRRFMLLGQTLDGMRVWDIRRAIQAVRGVKGLNDAPLWVQANDRMAVNALYASLFETDIAGLDLTTPPPSHFHGPDYLNVMRFLDVPQAVAMAAERSQLRLSQTDPQHWQYPAALMRTLGWDDDKLIIEPLFSAGAK